VDVPVPDANLSGGGRPFPDYDLDDDALHTFKEREHDLRKISSTHNTSCPALSGASPTSFGPAPARARSRSPVGGSGSGHHTPSGNGGATS